MCERLLNRGLTYGLYYINWCQDQQSGIRNMTISDSTNCLLYRVNGFSIPSWITCWVCERPVVLSNTFQRAEDLEATGVLTSSLQDKCVWTILSTHKLLVLVCELWCSLITSYTLWRNLGKPISLWGDFIYMVGKLSIPIIWLLMTCTWPWGILLPCWGWLLLTNTLKDLRIKLWLEVNKQSYHSQMMVVRERVESGAFLGLPIFCCLLCSLIYPKTWGVLYYLWA